MKLLTNKKNIFLVVGLIVIGAISRLLPHPPNVTPLTAMALFGGAYISRKYLAIILPLLVLFLSDFVINNTIARIYFPEVEGLVFFQQFMIYTYVGFFLIAMIGWTFNKKRSPGNLVLLTLASTIVFFLVSNFGSWASGIMYPLNFSGLISCYIAGLPFLLNSVLGNIFFVGLIFGAYHFIQEYKMDKVLVRS